MDVDEKVVRARADEIEKHLDDPYGKVNDLAALSFLVGRILARRAARNCGGASNSFVRDLAVVACVADGADLTHRLILGEAVRETMLEAGRRNKS